MRYILIIYFSASAWGSDVANYFPNKDTCYEALKEVKERPDHYYMAYCKPAMPITK